MKTNQNNQSTLKNISLAILAAGVLGLSYVTYEQYRQRAEMEKMIQVEAENMEQHLIDTYARIEDNLAEISAHEGVLRANLTSDEESGNLAPEDRIQREIDIISALMDQNNHLIAGLNAQVGEQDKQLKSYSDRVYKLNERLGRYQKQAETLAAANDSLHTDLATAEQQKKALNYALDFSQMEIEQQNRLIDNQNQELKDQEDAMNKAFFAVGPYQDLKEANVLEKEGGLIGIGATKALKDDFDRTCFTEIDRRDYTTIPVFSRKAKLVTTHDVDSYTWETDEEGVRWIKIKDPETFWENSRYCVVVTNDGFDLSFAAAK